MAVSGRGACFSAEARGHSARRLKLASRAVRLQLLRLFQSGRARRLFQREAGINRLHREDAFFSCCCCFSALRLFQCAAAVSARGECFSVRWLFQGAAPVSARKRAATARGG